MDAVAEARTDLERKLKQWYDDSVPFVKAAQAMGIDTQPFTAGLSGRIGTIGTGTTGAGTVRTSRRRSTGGRSRSNGGGGATTGTARTRATSRTGGTAGRGRPSTFDENQLIDALEPGVTQGQLASRFGVTRQTISRYLKKAAAEGRIAEHGAGPRKSWAPIGPPGGQPGDPSG